MEKLVRRTLLIALAIGAFASRADAGSDRSYQSVGEILMDSRACIFFTLNGVAQSDPVVSGPWFAIPRGATNYQEMVSLLFSSKLANRTLHVSTDGSTSCGWATVSAIGFNP